MKTVFNILVVALFLGVTPNPSFAVQDAAAPAAEKPKAHEVLTLHGPVLVVPAEKAIFVGKVEGGIEALDLATGKTLWQTKKEEGLRWPVAVYGRTLVVRVRDNPLRIAGLDLDGKGKLLWITEPVLPESVKGPEWMKEAKPRWLEEFERMDERRENKVGRPDRRELESAFLDRLKGTYLCEERIEKGEFVMRWRAETNPLDKPKEASGVVFIDLETGKLRTQPLAKDRKIEEKLPPATVECNEIVLSVAVSHHVGNWAKTLPASRFVTEGRYLRAVDKKTNKLLWERALQEWKYRELRRDQGR